MGSHPTIDGSSSAISSPDLRLRVFISSTSNDSPIDQAILSATTALGDSYLEKVADGRDLSMDEAISLIRENFAGPEPAVKAPAAV